MSASSSAAPGPAGRSSATPATSRIQSPRTASPTHCAMRNCWRARSLQGTTAAFADYETTRHDLSRRLFEITDDIASFTWTDGEVQSLHRAFSSEMSREVRALAALGAVTPLPPARASHVA